MSIRPLQLQQPFLWFNHHNYKGQWFTTALSLPHEKQCWHSLSSMRRKTIQKGTIGPSVKNSRMKRTASNFSKRMIGHVVNRKGKKNTVNKGGISQDAHAIEPSSRTDKRELSSLLGKGQVAGALGTLPPAMSLSSTGGTRIQKYSEGGERQLVEWEVSSWMLLPRETTDHYNIPLRFATSMHCHVGIDPVSHFSFNHSAKLTRNIDPQSQSVIVCWNIYSLVGELQYNLAVTFSCRHV